MSVPETGYYTASGKLFRDKKVDLPATVILTRFESSVFILIRSRRGEYAETNLEMTLDEWKKLTGQ